MKRPSKKELFRKLRDAKEAVKKGNVFLIDQDVIAELSLATTSKTNYWRYWKKY